MLLIIPVGLCSTHCKIFMSCSEHPVATLLCHSLYKTIEVLHMSSRLLTTIVKDLLYVVPDESYYFMWCIVLLPYFAQLAKVFSQGKYYVGGPRKVQICRNCLLTNTLIMRFCLFIAVNNCCLSRTIDTCAPICLFTVTVWTRQCPSLASSLSKQYPTIYGNDHIGRNSNLEFPIGRI
jgi:hypothetical protein